MEALGVGLGDVCSEGVLLCDVPADSTSSVVVWVGLRLAVVGMLLPWVSVPDLCQFSPLGVAEVDLNGVWDGDGLSWLVGGSGMPDVVGDVGARERQCVLDGVRDDKGAVDGIGEGSVLVVLGGIIDDETVGVDDEVLEGDLLGLED